MTIGPPKSICLAIDTSRRGGSVCIGSVSADNAIDLDHLEQLSDEKPAAVTLAGTIESMLASAPLPPTHVAVAIGPGSFTGLRVAVTTAKTLAYALSISAVAVDSLSAVANDWYHRRDVTNDLLVICRAYRRQSYVARFNRDCLDEVRTKMVPDDQLPSMVHDGSPTVLTDRSDIAGALPIIQHVVAARGVWLIARRMIDAGQTIDPLALQPNYFRPSSAEEQASKAEAAN